MAGDCRVHVSGLPEIAIVELTIMIKIIFLFIKLSRDVHLNCLLFE